MSKSITVSSAAYIHTDDVVRKNTSAPSRSTSTFSCSARETKNLPRYDEYNKKNGLHHLSAVATILGITQAQVATIEHEQFGSPMPTGVAQDDIPQFPTPGKAINKLSER